MSLVLSKNWVGQQTQQCQLFLLSKIFQVFVFTGFMKLGPAISMQNLKAYYYYYDKFFYYYL